MDLSSKGAAFIGAFEGFRSQCYDDAVGNCTIGFGHLIHAGRTMAADRAKWGTITRARGLELLQADAANAAAAVREHVHVPLKQGQFDALVSLAYNCGTGALGGGIRTAMRVGRFDLVPATILKYDKAGGHVLAGLTRRRRAEVALWVSHSHRAAAPTLSHLTARERATCLELDKLRRAGVHSKRRDELVAYATRQRKRIWHEANAKGGGGWAAHHRRERYHALNARTR